LTIRDLGEPRDLHRLALREEAIGDPALAENLDGAGVQATRARADEVVVGTPRDPYVDNNARISCLAYPFGSGFCPQLCGTTRVLSQAPRCAIYWEW
jgi:hypothetical protein